MKVEVCCLFLVVFCIEFSVSGGMYRGPPNSYSGAGCFPPVPYYQPEGRCPNINCTEPLTEAQTECEEDFDCLQKEKCCNYPCEEGKKVCMKTTNDYYETHVIECLVIKNCKKWAEVNHSPKVCDDNGDCARSEKCCPIPCNGKKMCQVPVEVILNSGLPTYNPPPPPIPPSIAAGRQMIN